MKKRYIVAATFVFIVLADRILSGLADRQIRASGIFEQSIPLMKRGLSEQDQRPVRTCKIKSAFALYLFQICFVPYTSGGGREDDGYYLVYHPPKPRLALIAPGNDPHGYYFREMNQGDYILFIDRVGEIRHGAAR